MTSRADHENGVRRNIALYALRYDDADVDGWIDTFTKDARLEVFGRVLEGRDAIVAAIAPSPDGLPAQHMTYNTLVDVDDSGATARATSDFVYLQQEDAGLVPTVAGRYYDDLVREGDVWRFAARVIVRLGDPAPGR